MESHVLKRKKRKTRKCLDEIWKRSRLTGQVLSDNDKFDGLHHKNVVSSSMLTNNRLTLRMLPRVILSKPITRPALLNLENEPNMNIDEVVKGIKMNTQNATKVRIPINTYNNRAEFFGHKKQTSDSGVLEIPVIMKEPTVLSTEKNDEDLDLFSSVEELTNKSPESIGTQSVSTLTSSSTQSIQGDNGYNLYEEFMSEVPACLQQNSRLLQGDIMKKTKMLLENLFIESCYEECENNVLKCIKNDTPKSTFLTSEVMQDPMNYIRLGHRQQKTQCHNLSSSAGSASSISCQTPLRPTQCLTSPSDTPPVSIVIQDTPDYTYYPHRLN